jgi:hypothetical protein
MTVETVLNHLKELQGQNSGIKACMVAKKGLEGVIMFPETFKKDAGPVWEPLSKALDHMLSIVESYSNYNLDKMFIEVLGFGVGFYILDTSDTALIIFIKQDENTLKTMTGLQDEINKTRKKIL